MIAIVLAGGKGSRLTPWHAPKCLLPINGISILERLLQHLAPRDEGPIHQVIICTGYRAADVERSVEAHGWRRPFVHFSRSAEDAAMGTRLLDVRERVAHDRAIICYGDELADVNVSDLLDKHEKSGVSMTFCVALQMIPGGMIDNPRGRIRIVEADRVPINIGFVIVEPECWSYLVAADGLSDWMNRASDRGGLNMYLHAGRRATVNSLTDLAYAEEVWK